MDLKARLLVLTLFVIVTSAFLTYYLSLRKIADGLTAEEYREGLSKEYDSAITQAKYIYEFKKKMGESFKNGPCLSNDLQKNWVADTVHSPREQIDDLVENQCPALLEGRAKHFVELDLSGELVRVK